MKEIFEEIIREANIGNIIIDGDDFPIAFNTIIRENNQEIFRNVEDDNKPTLIIKNQHMFYEKLTQYVELSLSKRSKMPIFLTNINRNNIKILVAYLFANATTEDFVNPIGLINRNIEFLTDDTFEYLNGGIKTNLENYFGTSQLNVKVTEQSIFMETINRIDISFTKETNGETVTFIFPSISYGISKNINGEKECYIYSIMHPKTKINQSEQQIKYSKKISRELYKLNAGVIDAETQEFKDYLNDETNDYPENISDISVSSLISLTTFLSLLEKEKIKVIKGISYLPIRFLSREMHAKGHMQVENKFRNIEIQTNITNKFIRTFRRMEYHLTGLEIVSLPYEISEFLELRLDGVYHLNNERLEEIHKSLENIMITNKKTISL